MALYLKNATYIEPETFLFLKAHIKVEEGIDGKIFFLDGRIPLESDKADQIIECSGKFVTDSLACGHHHVYSALARGMPAPKYPIRNFVDNLKYIWWTLDKSLDKESIKYSALATAIACAKNGVTFVIDHHASPFAIDGSLEIIANTFEEVGISHLLCYEISNRDGDNIAEKGLEETGRYLTHHQGLVGLHASFTVKDETLKKAVDLAGTFNTGIHIHVAEDQYDQKHCIEKYNIRVIERLKNFGVLALDKSILVHCLHIDDHERELINTSGVTVAENIESNLKNQVGNFSGKGLGDRIMLGTDGMHSDMIRSAKAAYFSGLAHENISPEMAYKRMRYPHQYLKNHGFSGDGENNLIILDYNTPTKFTPDNFLGHFIYGIESSHIEHVISNGQLIVENRKIKTVDEDKILVDSQKVSKSLWERMQSL